MVYFLEKQMDSMIATYLLAFCRIATGLIFLTSFLGKVRELEGFRQAVADFRLLPKDMSKGAAFLFLGGELLVVVCLLVGGVLLLPGFVLAILLLCVFSAAIALA